MKYHLYFLLFLSVVCYSQVASYQAVKCSSEITIDGKLTEADWQRALRFDRFYINDSSELGFPAEGFLLYDDDAIYLAGRTPLPTEGELVARETRRDGRVYSDDCFEFMLDPNKSGDRYVHILVNALGTIFDRYCDQGGHVGDSKWDGDITAAAFIGDDFWSVEVRVPFYTLDIDPNGNQLWGLNICHDNRNPRQDTAIAPQGVYNVAGSFLAIDGIEIDMTRHGWETSPTSVACKRDGEQLKVTLTTPLTNLSNQTQTVKIDYTLLSDLVSASAELDCTYQPGETFSAVAADIPVAHPGNFQCVVSVLDPVSRRIFKRRTYPVQIAFSPFEIILRKPHYRNMIFATQELEQVEYTVLNNLGAQAEGLQITTGIRRLDGTILCSQTVLSAGQVQFPVAPLPEERMLIFVSAAIDGQEMQEAITHPLRKLPYQQGEVWLDEDLYWRVDGERFFFMGGWNDIHVPGLNAIVGEAAVEPGGKFITGKLMWSSFPPVQSYRQQRITAEHEQIIRETVRNYRDNPDLFAYFLSDEPEIIGITVSGLTHAAEIIRDEDPYHPIIVSNDTVGGGKDFANAAEINGLHPYPNPAKNVSKSNFERVAAFMDQIITFNRGRHQPQTITYLQQGFNYGDHGAMNSRIPTYDEIRTQYLMTIILGGRGILTYNRTTRHYPELYLGIPAFVQELKFLAPKLSDEDVAIPANGCDNDKVRLLVKRHQGQLWILATSTTADKQEATFTLPELGNRKLQVLSEEREITVSNGQFTDVFDNFQVHIYTTDLNKPNLKSIAAIEKLIDNANQARRKPGNLAFQAFEHDSIKISASSNAATQRRPDTGLWHVTDGVIVDYELPPNRRHSLLWTDDTDNESPDWLELAFDKSHQIGRIVLYPYGKTLRDYELQAWINGDWQVVASKQDASESRLEHSFAPVTTDRVRLWVTGTNGPNVKLDEIEVYEK